MEKRELVIKLLENLGFKPDIDKDNDVFIQYQMKTVYFLVSDPEPGYVSVMLPQFVDVEEGQETIAVAVCNKITREIKMLKAYVDKSFKSVSATCEFYYDDEESLKMLIEHSLQVIGVARSMYRRFHDELTKD